MRSTGTRRRLLLLVMFAVVHEAAASGQARVTAVGIGGFRDESGTQVSGQVLLTIGSQLQRDLNDLLKDRLVARSLDDTGNRTVEDVAVLGKQQGVAFVVRGGLLSAAPNVQLYVDVINVATGGVTSLRAEGQSSNFDAAAAEAIRQLAHSIGEVVSAAEPVRDELVPSSEPVTAGASTAEKDEELWQLITEAEAVLASPSAVTTEALDSVRQSLDALNGALQSKASIVAEGRDPSEVDRLLAMRRQQLQAAVTIATEQAAADQTDPGSSQAPSEQKKSLLSALGERLAEAAGILQQIQELQSAWAGAQDDRSAETGVSGADQEALEEPLEEVAGVVTEEGAPVEGVTVTEPETGETATTDSRGSYVLRVVPGKLSRLVLTQNGKRLTTVQVSVLRGRPAVADFELKPALGPRRPALRVLPATVVVRSRVPRSGATGRLEGVVRDSRGRTVPRALVNLVGVAFARTDSQGRYAFIGAPAGVHQLTVYRSGLKPQTTQVQIAVRGTSRSGVDLAAKDTPLTQQRGAILASPGASPLLLGVVTGSQRQPLAGAKVTLLQGTRAVSVLSSRTGSYAFRAIEPGGYRAVVSKFGYGTETTSLELRSGRTERRDFALRKSSTAVTLPTVPGRPAPATRSAPAIGDRDKPRTDTGDRGVAITPRRPVAGSLRGQVVDATTRRPVAGATVSVSGARTDTNQGGSFVLGNLPPGSYQIVVRRSGYADGRANVTIRAGETVTLDLRLTPRPAMRRR